MTHAHCAHCRRTYTPDPIERSILCDECADLAVLGEPCAYCDEVPGHRPCED